MVTFNRIAPGEFHAIDQHGNDTGWRIVNGSHGFRGRDAANTYGFFHADRQPRPRWVGPIKSAKRLVIMAVSASIAKA